MAGPNGWNTLGEALAGGNAGAMSPGYQRGAQSAARVANWLADARKAETEGRLLLDKERARQQFEGSLVASGENAQTAKLLSDAFAAGYNPEQLSGYQAEHQKTGIGAEAAVAARGGDVDLMNNLLTAFEGKPRQRTRIDNGVAFDPYASPGQPLVTTEGGMAATAANQGLAAARFATAGVNDARAALYGRTDPNRAKGKAAEREWQVESIESELGRKLTAQELVDLANNKLNIKIPPAAPTQASAAPRTRASRAWSADEVQQAIGDAREAIRRGALTKEQAKKRLSDAGLTNAAKVL